MADAVDCSKARELDSTSSTHERERLSPTAAEETLESALTPKVASLASDIENPPERWERETPKFSSESHLRPSFLEAPAERRTKRASM